MTCGRTHAFACEKQEASDPKKKSSVASPAFDIPENVCCLGQAVNDLISLLSVPFHFNLLLYPFASSLNWFHHTCSTWGEAPATTTRSLLKAAHFKHFSAEVDKGCRPQRGSKHDEIFTAHPSICVWSDSGTQPSARHSGWISPHKTSHIRNMATDRFVDLSPDLIRWDTVCQCAAYLLLH